MEEVSNYVPSQGDAIALLQARGAPLTPFNVKNAMQILVTNPTLRPTPTAVDAQQLGSGLPSLDKAFPAGEGDYRTDLQSAPITDTERDQASMARAGKPTGPGPVSNERARTRKPPVPGQQNSAEPGVPEQAAPIPDTVNGAGDIPWQVVGPTAAAGAGGLLAALTMRRGVRPSPAAPLSAPRVEPGVPSAAASAAPASGEAAVASKAASPAAESGASATGEAVSLKGTQEKAAEANGINTGVKTPDEGNIQVARKNLREARASKDYAKIRRWKKIVTNLEGGGAE